MATSRNKWPQWTQVNKSGSNLKQVDTGGHKQTKWTPVAKSGKSGHKLTQVDTNLIQLDTIRHKLIHLDAI